MSDVLLGLFSGIFFGFIIQRIGATNAHEMARAHLMINSRIPRFMVLVVAIAALGLFGLKDAGIGHTVILPTSLVATGLAAIIFGIGWGIAGYCPGTTWAAVGEGRMDAIFAFLGGLAGTAVFAQVHHVLVPLLYDPTNVGQLTVADIVGSAPAALILVVGALVGGAVVMKKLWVQEDYEATDQF
ncbi:MAG: YeeE/YedE thiosulfate transporter family protein [Desulfurivibrionaceae bacterium]|nr:YeeE/YedE thiosulfate transporter family protein [Desulfurivibrionaceae bacterium]